MQNPFVLGLLLLALLPPAAPAEEPCPTPDKPIATDRPDVTNSSLVVPKGSFQNENGINVAISGRDRILDGTNSRLRLGIAQCLEVLVDLPSRFMTLRGDATQGFTNVAPAIKWQISPDPGKFDLSATFGVGLPTGGTALNGPGAQPYLQFPWSKELGQGWGISGMFTLFTRPADPVSRLTTEVTFVLEKEIWQDVEIFTEYVGDFPDHGRSRQLINSGVGWQVTKTQQLDMHFAFGLNSNSPELIVGIGYSFRRDGLF